MKEVLEQLAAFAAASTVAVIAIATVHEYGFFAYVGRSFQPLLTTSDYFGNVFLYLPLTMFIAYQWINVPFLRDETRTFEFKTWTPRILLTVLVLMYLYLVVFEDERFVVGALSVLFFTTFWTTRWKGLATQAAPDSEPGFYLVRQLIRVGPILVVAFFFVGLYNGHNALENEREPYIFNLKSPDRVALRIFLRSFDKGVLVYDAPERRVEFHKWDTVALISKPIEKTRFRFACWAFSTSCPEELKP